MDPPHFCVIVTQEQIKVGIFAWYVGRPKQLIFLIGPCNGCSFVVTHLISMNQLKLSTVGGSMLNWNRVVHFHFHDEVMI